MLAGTAEKAASTSKVKLYLDGQEIGSGDGVAGIGIDASLQPLIIGGIPNVGGSCVGAMPARIGPVIITKNALTPAQVAEVTHLLLARRKLQEAV